MLTGRCSCYVQVSIVISELGCTGTVSSRAVHVHVFVSGSAVLLASAAALTPRLCICD